MIVTSQESNIGNVLQCPAGVIYIIRAPHNAAIKVPQLGLSAENEWILLNQIQDEFIIETIPAARIAALKANNQRLLIPAR